MTRPGLMVVGTDTGVGKTRVASAIVRVLTRQGVRVGALKPVATGVTDPAHPGPADDPSVLAASLGGGVPTERVTPLTFPEPLAPCVAARRAGSVLRLADVVHATSDALGWWEPRADVVVVEGVGGLLCPLGEDSTLIDLAVWLDFPLVIVARRALGTLNHSLLTAEAAERRGLRLAGIILNQPEPGDEGVAEQTNPEELSRRLPRVPILAQLRHGEDGTGPEALGGVSWADLAAGPRFRPVPPEAFDPDRSRTRAARTSR